MFPKNLPLVRYLRPRHSYIIDYFLEASFAEENLKDYFETIPKPFILAVESTYNWYFLLDLAQPDDFQLNSYLLIRNFICYIITLE